jgi:hypothetical protein
MGEIDYEAFREEIVDKLLTLKKEQQLHYDHYPDAYREDVKQHKESVKAEYPEAVFRDDIAPVILQREIDKSVFDTYSFAVHSLLGHLRSSSQEEVERVEKLREYNQSAYEVYKELPDTEDFLMRNGISLYLTEFNLGDMRGPEAFDKMLDGIVAERNSRDMAEDMSENIAKMRLQLESYMYGTFKDNPDAYRDMIEQYMLRLEEAWKDTEWDEKAFGQYQEKSHRAILEKYRSEAKRLFGILHGDFSPEDMVSTVDRLRSYRESALAVREKLPAADLEETFAGKTPEEYERAIQEAVKKHKPHYIAEARKAYKELENYQRDPALSDEQGIKKIDEIEERIRRNLKNAYEDAAILEGRALLLGNRPAAEEVETKVKKLKRQAGLDWNSPVSKDAGGDSNLTFVELVSRLQKTNKTYAEEHRKASERFSPPPKKPPDRSI